MYIVNIKNGNFVTRIHGADQRLTSGSITKGINTIDTFTFTMLPDNAGFYLINEFTTIVYVVNTTNNKYEFVGRVLYADTTMSESGLITKSVTCESVAGYLCDSIQTYRATQNWSVAELLSHLIKIHNSMVEPEKQFNVGTVTATDSNDNLYQGIQRENTWDAIKNKLLDKIGGELQFRVETNGLYIDYLDRIGGNKSTAIELSVNMKSITREQNPTTFITRLIPLGSKIESEEEDAQTDNDYRIGIESVNDGVSYIDDETAIAVYGIHVGVQVWDNVSTPNILLSKARAWLAENNRVQVKYSITALDLHLLGLSLTDFEVGNHHPIYNSLLGIDDTARIIKKTIDICDAVKSSIEVGDNLKTLSDIQMSQMQGFQSFQSETLQWQETQTGVVDDIRTSVSNQKVDILKDCDKLIVEAGKSYVTQTAYSDFLKKLETDFEVYAEGIKGSVTATEQEIQRVDGDLQEKFNTITKYFTFTVDGLTIGQVDNPNKVVIDNDHISIMVYNNAVQEFNADGTALIPTLKITDFLSLLGLRVTETETHINCDY